MQVDDRFAVRSAATSSVVTTGEVRGVTHGGKAVFVLLRHTKHVERFVSTNGGRTYYTTANTYYFSSTSDSLPPKL